MATRREELYPEIKRLREEEGLMWREIGARLGLATQTVHDYYSDPDNSKHMERHRRWQANDVATCERCGGRMPGATARRGGRCMACHREIDAAAILARLEDVAEMYREGMPVREIAAALGYGPNSNPPQISEAFRRGLLTDDDRRYQARRKDAA